MSVEYIEKNQGADLISTAMPGDYFQLMKPRVMALVIFTAVIGLLLAPGSINPFLGLIAVLCISIGAGASGALNMWYDADIDRIMQRTENRPIPAGKVSAESALAFGIVLSILSVMTLGVLINWLSAFSLAFTIFFYSTIYTIWLKRTTPQNIVIGGAAGAFPPMIGWAAVTGNVSIESVALFVIIFLWTPPHFWALALFRAKDYEAAGIPMMPNVRGEANTRLQILIYTIPLVAAGILPTLLGFASIFYGLFAAGLGARFLYMSFRVWRSGTSENGYAFEKKLFGFSILYLFALFAWLGAEAVLTRTF